MVMTRDSSESSLKRLPFMWTKGITKRQSREGAKLLGLSQYAFPEVHKPRLSQEAHHATHDRASDAQFQFLA